MLQPLRAAEKHLRAARADVQLDPHVQHLLGDAYSVHAQQQYRGLSVYPHSMVLTIEPTGKVTRSGDPLLRIRTLDVVPTIGAETAARAAFDHLRAGSCDVCQTAHAPLFEDRGYRPRVVSAFPMPNRPTVLSAGPFHEPVQTNLVVFRSANGPVLGWLVSFAVTHHADFTIVIAADEKTGGALLYCAAEAASACIASVFPFSAAEAARDIVFPRSVADYPPGLRPTNGFRDWVESDQLDGNNALMRIGTKKCVVKSTLQSSMRRFTPASGSLEEQATNAFFVCNFMHDFFSLIGFGERDGNFQQKNFGGEGKAGDRLVVSIVTGAQGNANMRAQNDGSVAELTLGRWRNADAQALGNPTALDAGVVIHEFAHGVSQRLVSGRLKKSALSEPQPLALGEAWSDYFAVTILNFYRVSVAAGPRPVARRGRGWTKLALWHSWRTDAVARTAFTTILSPPSLERIERLDRQRDGAEALIRDRARRDVELFRALDDGVGEA